jgi:hypothetical protein
MAHRNRSWLRWGIQKPPTRTSVAVAYSNARGVIMGSGAVVASAWSLNVPRFLAAALLTVVCLGTSCVSAAEGDRNADRGVHPSQYSDPRCESRRIGPNLERVETRCDLREPRRKADQHAPVTSPPIRPVGQAPVTSASDPSRQQPRSVDRDVGFDDAFTTQGTAPAGGGASGANANAGAGANPGGAAAAAAEAQRTPPGRAR